MLFDELMKSEDGVRRDSVAAFGRSIKLRSLTAEEMLIHTEENEKSPENKRVAGVRLLVASIEDDDGNRIEEGQQPALVRKFLQKDFYELQRATRVARRLNGVSTLLDSKNASGEAKAAASPSA